MNEWEKVKLGEVLKEVNERNKGEKVKRVLSVTNSRGFVSQEEYFEGTVHSANISNYKIVRKNQFAYNPSRVNVGSIDILKDYEYGALSPMYIVFEVDTNKLLPDYFKYYFQTNRFFENVKNNTQGSVRNSLSFKALADFDYLLPPIEEQEKIIYLLNIIEKIINKNDEEINLMHKQKNKILNDAIKKYSNKKILIGDIFNKITDFVAAGSFADLRKNVKYNSTENYAQLIRTVDIKNKFKNTGSVYIDKNAFDFLWRVNLIEDNIILPNIGANIGEVYYLKAEDLPYKHNVLGPNAILLGKCKNLKYMYYYFQSNTFKEQLELIVGASGQPKFNKTDLKKIKVKIPEENIIQNIISVLEKTDRKIEKTKQKKFYYENLKKGLMQKLLTGKVRVKI